MEIFIGIGIFVVCFILFFFYSIYYCFIKPVHYYGCMTIDENGNLQTKVNVVGRGTSYYSIAYSEERFSQIKQGMTKEEVLDLLGFPLFPDRKEVFQSETWEYAGFAEKKCCLVRDVIFKDNKVEKTVKANFMDMLKFGKIYRRKS